ncbi:MAG: DegT/DnrJ/EryC1/StrS family aminotransferase [Polyangia bacterium]|jgi:dTDP-4-amino-4,6-dideoxygalactose transaminase
MLIPIVRPALGEAEVEAAIRVIRSGWLAQGPEVAALEEELAGAVGAAHAVAVANCTLALQLCLHALDVGQGCDVATVSHSFIATANAVVAVGARPVFVDIDPSTYGMDAKLLEQALTPATRAILCVHQLGFPCALPEILAIADRHALPVIEDAACAVGSEIRIGETWQRIGQPHGKAACFSFHPRKVITTGEGGIITTSDPALADRLRCLRQHGLPTFDPRGTEGGPGAFTSFVEPAFNFRMTDLQAALARPQLARLHSTIAERRALAERYREALSGHPTFEAPREPPWARVNFQSYPLRVRAGARLTQVEIMKHLGERGIASRRGVGNAHAEPAYRRAAWTCGGQPCDLALHGEGRCLRLANSEAARDTTVMIPLFHGLTRAEQDNIIATLRALA